MAKKPAAAKTVESLKHPDSKRKNIPTAEYLSVQDKAQQAPKSLRYPRNTDLDPQLVWRGKDEQDWSDLVVQAPPIYIQEKVHPKALIDDLLRQTKESAHEAGQSTADLFSDFNGIPKGADKTEFYAHDQNWSNRMILGDSLQVMASLAEREGLRGRVQCIYFDPPYGIKFNSNFQWSTTSRDVKDGKAEHITREPEQVKAFRDTWRDGIHSYLTYLRDRLTVARDLLTESGSIFVQIGDENIHRVRAVLDEVFGDENHIATISFQKTGSTDQALLPQTVDYILYYGKNRSKVKYRQMYLDRQAGTPSLDRYDLVIDQTGRVRRVEASEATNVTMSAGASRARLTALSSARPSGEGDMKSFEYQGRTFTSGAGTFKTNLSGMKRLGLSGRLYAPAGTLQYMRKVDDFPVLPIADRWESVQLGTGLIYVVQTSTKAIERCVLMATDPGDLVLDPTCGSGTTATVAEQWGRRWITIDTSRVALALARARIMGARYPYYLLADSRQGQIKEAEVTGTAPSSQPVYGNIRHGFVYERVPHISLKSIVNNAEIDVIWEQWQKKLEPLRDGLNADLKKNWPEWDVPREVNAGWSEAAKKLHADWWQARIARQQEIDKSIASKAEFERLFDRPYADSRVVRVAGPFTVESLSPHRMLAVDEYDGLIDPLVTATQSGPGSATSFEQMILENLKVAGVQQSHKEGRIRFTSLVGWPGRYICAEGLYQEAEIEKRAGIFIGPEFGTVSRPDLVEAAREAGDAGFDVLIACAFNYEAHASEFSKLGRIPVLKARMNADLQMASDLKATGKGNLFVIFGEPDIEVLDVKSNGVLVKIKGVDVFDPSSGDVRSDGAEGIACWFIDTDYNGESFFVRQAYFLGQNDPYKSLRTTLKAEINQEAWESLNSDTSRPFDKPKSGRIAVKVINHLGDEVMKVFRIQ
jgi:adenine-specific DNA-methyltransferase